MFGLSVIKRKSKVKKMMDAIKVIKIPFDISFKFSFLNINYGRNKLFFK